MEAVIDYITNNFKNIGGKIRINVDDDNISIQWIPDSYDDLDNIGNDLGSRNFKIRMRNGGLLMNQGIFFGREQGHSS